MALFGNVVRFGYAPFQLLVVNGVALAAIASGAGMGSLALLLAAAIATSFAAERAVPWIPEWNESRGDGARDAAHALVNETLNAASVAALPALSALGLGLGRWPDALPFVIQVAFSIVALDLGVTAAHHASHRIGWLWRFHAVHHSVERMYGFNGLMKHPVHQSIEMAAGTLPLLLLGMPVEVGLALAFCTAIQLLVQHSNVDIRLGPFRGWVAAAEIHRLHHRRGAVGDVNFGLFTTLGDRLFGTFEEQREEFRLSSAELGVEDELDYPTAYMAQLVRPFERNRPGKEMSA